MVDYQTKAPGVYIEEFTPAGPIAGSGTSTAASGVGSTRKPAASAQGATSTTLFFTDHHPLSSQANGA